MDAPAIAVRLTKSILSVAREQPKEDAEIEYRGDDEHDQKYRLACLVMEVRAARPAADESADERERVQHDLRHAQPLRDRLMLVTDAMPLVGTDQRHFLLQDRQITLQDGRLTGPDGTLAGAHLTMMEAVRNAVTLVGVGIADALTMATRTPATFLGLQSELGSVAPGYRADLVAIKPANRGSLDFVAGNQTCGFPH